MKKKNIVFIIAGIVVLILIGVSIGYLIYHNQNNQNLEKTNKTTLYFYKNGNEVYAKEEQTNDTVGSYEVEENNYKIIETTSTNTKIGMIENDTLYVYDILNNEKQVVKTNDISSITHIYIFSYNSTNYIVVKNTNKTLYKLENNTYQLSNDLDISNIEKNTIIEKEDTIYTIYNIITNKKKEIEEKEYEIFIDILSNQNATYYLVGTSACSKDITAIYNEKLENMFESDERYNFVALKENGNIVISHGTTWEEYTKDKSKVKKNYLKKKFGIQAYKDLNITILKQLKEAMKELTDTRVSYKTTYKLWDIVVCVVISVLCGAKDWEEIHDFVEQKYHFFRTFLKMSGGIPCSVTYERVMAIIDYQELEKLLTTFFKTITCNLVNDIEILSIDGRVNNGSKRKKTIKKEEISPLNMLNVYSSKYQLCLASKIIENKTNEIPNVEEILKTLNIENTIVTWDALNTQKSNVLAVVNQGGYYVVPIKGNHPLFYQELVDFFDHKEQEYIVVGKRNTSYKKTREYKNGSAITYEYFQTEEVEWFEDRNNWKDLHSFCMVKKTIESASDTRIEYRYYISNLFINIDLVSRAIREHWNVENKLHWHLDFTFMLDKNNTLNKNALANFEIVNKFCLGILQKAKKYYGNKSLKKIINILSLNVEENIPELISFLALPD